MIVLGKPWLALCQTATVGNFRLLPARWERSVNLGWPSNSRSFSAATSQNLVHDVFQLAQQRSVSHG